MRALVRFLFPVFERLKKRQSIRKQTGTYHFLFLLMLFFFCVPVFAQSSVNAALERLSVGEIETSLDMLELLAGKGDTHAQSALGDIYEQGRYVPQNYETAVYWRKLAAAQSHPEAMNALGRHFAEGIGIAQDKKLALHYLRAAAEKGDAVHQYDFAVLLEKQDSTFYNPEEAAQWYERAVQQNFVSAQANLGLLYYLGKGVQQDYEKALRLLGAAADQGHPNAQNNLGLMYTRGHGVALDYAKAVIWFQSAAEQGLAQAMTNMGVMYENGFGVTQDDAKAKQYYILGGQQGGLSLPAILAEIGLPYDTRLAPLSNLDNETHSQINRSAALGDPVATYQLGFLLSQDRTNNNYTLAAKWYSHSAGMGMREAMLNLGLLHMNGLGVAQDYVLGYHWIIQATALGSPMAARIRDTLLKVLTAEQINQAQTMQINGAQ